MASTDSEESDFEGFTASDLEEYDDNRSEIGSDISVSPCSSPDVSEAELSDSESDDDDPHNEEWTGNLRATKVDDFRGRVGSNIELGPLKTEKDFFMEFFPNSLVEKIVFETNNYARKMTEQKPDPKWSETNMAEIWAFLGIFVVLSVMQLH